MTQQSVGVAPATGAKTNATARAMLNREAIFINFAVTADNQPVKNAELWQRLDSLVQQHKVSWHWVKGHSGDPGNERADALANKGVASVSR